MAALPPIIKLRYKETKGGEVLNETEIELSPGDKLNILAAEKSLKLTNMKRWRRDRDHPVAIPYTNGLSDNSFAGITSIDVTGDPVSEHHAKRAHLEVYVVSGKIWGCKKMVGVRGNIYKLFASHNGYYDLVNNDVQASQKVSYDGDNLSFSVMFKSEANAASFVNSGEKLKNLPMMVEDQIRISDPAPYDIQGELKLYRATDYDPSTSDSPCTQRDDVRTANSATAGEPTEATDDLMKYQSVENYETRNPMISWYSCHIIDKSLSKKFASSPSNLLAGTWTPFHQLYDGLKVPDNVPGINISFVRCNNKRDAQMDNRYKVTIEIEFRNEDCEAALAPLLKVGSTKVSQLKYQTFIHVKEPAITQQCLEWKSKRTAEHWRKYLQELEE